MVYPMQSIQILLCMRYDACIKNSPKTLNEASEEKVNGYSIY
ncbi:unnamed protein product [Larinioides sclopetarius]|uniref:Uncharacterized protein n=1 Tax=Larinioides sclopetarius TaxID=280406 RepID=A0AAV1ZQM3_9ARAC